MPRPALILIGWLWGSLCGSAAVAAAPTGIDPHLDPSLVPSGCRACHVGHGVSGSPMLDRPQADLCLGCHGSQADSDRQVRRGNLDSSARPPRLSGVLALPFTHPLTEGAYSRHEGGVVTCSSCHSPHRGSRTSGLRKGVTEAGGRKPSPRNPVRFEVELCQECHGSEGARTVSLTDLSRLLSPNSRSYHPLEAPAASRSPSLRPELAGTEINCTDCHGVRDPSAPAGPHGSTVPHLLRADYASRDGSEESVGTYALCYGCHDREAVLDRSPFPYHRLHVVEERTSCATCHNPHGSAENRALVRFGEETFLSGAAPAVGSGLLAFVSTAPGSGTCWVSCHAASHDPATYGTSDLLRPGTEIPGALGPGDIGIPPGPGALAPDRFSPIKKARPRRPPP